MTKMRIIEPSIYSRCKKYQTAVELNTILYKNEENQR